MVSNPSANRDCSRLSISLSIYTRVHARCAFKTEENRVNPRQRSCSRNEFNVGNNEEIKMIQVFKEYVRDIEFKYSIRAVLSEE